MFSPQDLKQLQDKGISAEIAQLQIHNFEKGFPFAQLTAPATAGEGIVRMSEEDIARYTHVYEQESSRYSVIKFVPASGAATRMFKDLFQWQEQLESGISTKELVEKDALAQQFFSQINTFAFWDDLCDLMHDNGQNAQTCLDNHDYKTLLKTLLDDDEGLGYAMLPKGLLQFHRYADHNRTAFEEHLVEGALYARDDDGKVMLHFTVSPEHRARFINHLGTVLEKYEKDFRVQYEVSFSAQKPSTDTLAVTPDNQPFRNPDGSLLFRPGGHGALIQNLNDLNNEVVFIKNIDNVVPDSSKQSTITFKKALGGLLLELVSQIHQILSDIDNNLFEQNHYESVKDFMQRQLNIPTQNLPAKVEQGKEAIYKFLSRPIRVCGMVPNIGEPGGGPFWTKNHHDGELSLQIVESSQVDVKDVEQRSIFEKATHFNPVDLVCFVKDHNGNPYDLTQYIDPTTGFISHKSKDGKDLKAQELPGLWNGSMAGWITLFVEVPITTFNPVKTIMDLLREEHRQ